MADNDLVRWILVAVPAHDEQQLLGRALEAVLHSAAHVRRQRPVRVVVGVAAHRCNDDTFSVATTALARADGIEAVVVQDQSSRSVGEVRHRLVSRLAGRQLPPSATWVLSTDADSVVPPDWMLSMIEVAEREAAVAVAGMTELIDWSTSSQRHTAYEAIIAAGLTEDGGHRHVYAANLAVRLDAYRAAGGFPSTASGEDHGLIRAIRANGGAVATPQHPRVRTSGRVPGRAAHGLANLLATL
jgi:hypothetical protein